MDIYTATSAVQRLIKFAEDTKQANSVKYASSIKRYENLIGLLKEATEMFEQCLPTSSNTLRRNNAGCVIQCDPAVEIEDSKPAVKQHSKQRVLDCYAAVISKLSNTPSGYYEIDQFTAALQHWYQVRFVQCGDVSNFQCNTKYLGKWLLQLTVCYGNSLESETSEEFLHHLSEFTYGLENGFSQSRYILPAEIYKQMKELTGDTTSLTGAVIWDILYDLGLHSLDPKYSVSYLPKDSAKDLYDQRSEDIPHYYHHYTASNRVLSRSKITPYTQGGDDGC